MIKLIEFTIPVKTPSFGNIGFSLINPRVSWAVSKKQKDEQKKALYQHWIAYGGNLVNFKLPLHIKFYRISPRQLDSDNLLFALKTIRDELCSYIIPGLAKGQADRTGFTFEYFQYKEKPKYNAVKIEIFKNEH